MLKDLYGMAPSSAEVEVFAGEKSLGTIKADATGRWKIEAVAVPPGISIHAVATDGDTIRESSALTIDADESADEQDVRAAADYSSLVQAVADGAGFDSEEAQAILAAAGVDAERFEADVDECREIDRRMQTCMQDFEAAFNERARKAGSGE